ncbi:hypothetical protein BO79DRAFT_216362 [Aspergillus costaricaensis CBS 115574]|uniref:Uncharacterized protein n=1 Tax=Aspergillus costaricaensis CBS 115574 TaxID=1448317 RepID=A0ACD1IHV6_9EURO|nr:hypothetical protein BO79DRAFT_216362 [Aspergillus costaricaensis CBS 115574]RAK90191.1 hypothetical protein BO79DRAFT_216362 [Aspergillus costaricaensis CBS 115574]
MGYIARTNDLPDIARKGSLVDPRAEDQPLFFERMSCRDVNDLGMRLREPAIQSQANIDEFRARSEEIKQRMPVRNPKQPISDLVPDLVVTGGLSHSPAVDYLPVFSHWADRTGELSATDPDATVRLTSTWGTAQVAAEGVNMDSPRGAHAWSLKSHGIGPAEPEASKFSQQYDAETDTLTTTVKMARRQDTPRTDGVLAAVSSVSWMRNARVADAVDCAAGLLADASTLLEARDRMIATGTPERVEFAEVRPVDMPSWCSARKPLAPKLSGVAVASDPTAVNLFAGEDCQGPILNTSVFAMTSGYNRGVYGGSISGLWSTMNASFVMDYSIGVHSAAMADKLTIAFADAAAAAEKSAYAGPHITDISLVKGCNYSCLRQKTVIEDSHRPTIVVWDDLARLARYKLADAVFCHVYYDGGGSEHMAAIAGLGCVAHDWIDLGADVACGEVSNIIPSLTRGSLEEAPLAEVYARITGAMIWYRENDPYNPAANCLLFTHWWQLSNCRHRPVTLLSRTDLPVDAGIVPIVPDERPPLEHFRANGTKVERGERALANAEARLEALIASDPLPETRAVIDLLVKPVLAYVRGGDTLPSENEYVGATLAAQLAYPQDQKILEMWDLAIVMWECGALWASGVADLC